MFPGSGERPATADGRTARLQAAIMRLSKEVHGAIAAAGVLTPAQAEVFRQVLRPEGLRASAIAERLGVAPSAVTALLDRLEERGLLERTRDPRDRRVVRVRATDAGARAFETTERAVRDCLAGLLGRVEPDDVDRFLESLERMTRYDA